MLFILHNNVVLSLFLRAFCCIFCTVFCILYTYFLHILYIFYTYFVHFSRYFYAKITHFSCIITHFHAFLIYFRVFLTHFRAFFLLISYNFLYICTNIACISMHTRAVFRFASFFIFCTFVQTFSTHCTKLHLRSAQLCTNFFQLAAVLFPACEKLCNNLFPASLQDFIASHSFFLCDYSFFLPFRFCFYCFFHS